MYRHEVVEDEENNGCILEFAFKKFNVKEQWKIVMMNEWRIKTVEEYFLSQQSQQKHCTAKYYIVNLFGRDAAYSAIYVTCFVCLSYFCQ